MTTMERDYIRWSKRGVRLSLKDAGPETEIYFLGRSYSINPKLSEAEKERLATFLNGMPVTEDSLHAALNTLDE